MKLQRRFGRRITWLAVDAILNSVFSLGVYIRIVVLMYGPAKEAPVYPPPAAAVWTITLALTLGIGLAAQVLLSQVA